MTAGSEANPLALKIKDRIRREGPIPVSEYMRICLGDPEHGYYRTRIAIGAGGDFTTSPEISQTFGELIGIWTAVAWRAMGAPAQVNLVELGPGRGTMMADMLRAGRIVPGFLGAARVHLVESSPILRDVQRQTLAKSAEQVPIIWHETFAVEFACDQPTILLANEFLDALPVCQLVFTRGEWRRRCVGLDTNGEFAFVPGEAVVPERLPTDRAPREGDIFEFHPDFPRIADLLQQLAAKPLAALFIDYGHIASAFGDTLQAVRQHRYASVLEHPGEADLTAHVDFETFRRHCVERKLAVDGPITQAQFLLNLGLAERSQKLMSTARPEEIGLIEAGVQRIADPFGMGGRFKVICVRSPNVPALPPFPPTS